MGGHGSVSDDKTISTQELAELRERDGVGLGKYVSVVRGRARVEIVSPDGARMVTVVDPVR